MSNINKQTEENTWYAIRTFNCQERKVSHFLEEKGYTHFIPMAYSKSAIENKTNEAPQRKLVPAIHNLLFVLRKGSAQETLKELSECTVPLNIFRHPGEKEFCEISSQDMIELRMLCDPQFQTSVFMTQPEAEAMVGKEVRVITGPFKGSIGRLVRKNKQYYFLKTVIGMGVMVRISRWYCEAINN